MHCALLICKKSKEKIRFCFLLLVSWMFISFNAFLPQNPIKDYRQAPMNKQLSNWFDSIVVTRKREDISNLLKKLVGKYSPENLPLPDIPLPTLNGKWALNFGFFPVVLSSLQMFVLSNR